MTPPSPVPTRGPAPDVGAVIVNWNSSDDTLRCVDNLRRLYPSLDVTVVDNGSDPQERQTLAGAPEHVTVLQLDTNGGYAAGVNAGVRRLDSLGTTWAWLVNPDASPEAGSLEEMLARSGGAVAISPRQYASTEQGAGETYASAATTSGTKVSPFVCEGCEAGQHDVDVVTGTGLLVKVPDAVAVGLLDESFFHYKEEFEFVERLSARGAVRLVCHATCWHRRGGSLAQDSPRATYFSVRNEILYLRMRSRLWFVQPRFARYLVRTAPRALRRSTPRSHRQSVRHAVVDGIAGTGGPGRSR